MAAPATLSNLLNSLTQSLALTQEAVPKIADLEHPKNGISLLDVKNELLLSYLQNLIFLILLKLRNAKSRSRTEDGDEDDDELDESVRAKLVELRLYLEKGARPLEDKLKFSIERFLRTAKDAQHAKGEIPKAKATTSANDSIDDEVDAGRRTEEEEEEEEEEEDDDDDNESAENNKKPSGPLLQQGSKPSAPNFTSLIDDETVKLDRRAGGSSGVYVPPRRDRVVMEMGRPRERNERRAQKSFTMEEFVQDEFSSAPRAEPSIGTTIVQGGRKMKSAEERREEAERREYEETNFVRLPAESKKEKAKKNRAAGRNNRMQFGGEEWHNLGEGVDRIDRLTQRKGPAGGTVRALLDKSRKRGHDTTDRPRSSGHVAEIGERFRKKAKLLEAGRTSRGRHK